MSVPAFNPFTLKSVFTTVEAACAIAGVFTAKEAFAQVETVVRELELSFPPVKKSKRVGNLYFDSWHTHEWTEHAEIPRADLMAWCAHKGIRPPLLFPDPPPAPTQEPERPLHESERATLLRIIRALAELHGVKQTGDAYRSEATRLLQKCSSKGIADPCTDKSLAKHLKAAFDSR